MKRLFVVLALLVVAAVGGAAIAYQTSARQRDYRALLARGDAALRDDQTFAAIEAYSGAIALRPDSMLAHLRRAETYERRGDRGDLDAAARDFRTAAGLDPSAPRPLEELGDVLYQLQGYERAAEAYEASFHLDDRSPRVSYKTALARYRVGDAANIETALKALGQTVRLDDRMADAYYMMGLAFEQLHRLPEALGALEHAVSMAPGSIPAREELADLYGRLERRHDELEQLQTLAGLDRSHVERDVAVALAHARARHWDLAIVTLTSALERTPDDPVIYRALGRVWLDSAEARDDRVELGKARQALEQASGTPVQTSEVLTLSGRAALLDGDAETAELTLQQAMTRYPLDPSAFLIYATAAERQNHYEAARRALIQYGGIVSDDPGFVSRATHIAELSLKLKEAETAADWFQEAEAASPVTDLHLLAALADAQFKAGKREASRATIARGLDKDPQNLELLAVKRKMGAPAAQ
jgi:tetratricopeptide (TPR) repeat protein